MSREVGLIFCGPKEVMLLNVIFYFIFMKCCFLFVKVYEALKSSAVVVYIMLTAMYLIPIWIYSGINVTRLTHFYKTRWIFGVYLLVYNFRLTKSYHNKKSKSLLLLPTVPVLLSFLSGLGIILPCSGIFVEVKIRKHNFPRKTM